MKCIFPQRGFAVNERLIDSGGCHRVAGYPKGQACSFERDEETCDRWLRCCRVLHIVGGI